MNLDELSATLAATNLSEEMKLKAITMALQIAVDIALKSSSEQAGGGFFQLLMELFKLLLPLLLELLKPKV